MWAQWGQKTRNLRPSLLLWKLWEHAGKTLRHGRLWPNDTERDKSCVAGWVALRLHTGLPIWPCVLQACNIKEPRGLIRRNLWSFPSPQELLSSRMDWELNKKPCKEHHGPDRERERGLDSPWCWVLSFKLLVYCFELKRCWLCSDEVTWTPVWSLPWLMDSAYFFKAQSRRKDMNRHEFIGHPRIWSIAGTPCTCTHQGMELQTIRICYDIKAS